MKHTLYVAAIGLVILLRPEFGDAQERLVPEIITGTRVQFVRDMERTRREGVVVSRTDSAVLVRDAISERTFRAVLDSVRDLAIGIPRSAGAGAARGGAIGLGVGAVLTVAATTVVWLSDADERCNDCFINATAGTVILGGLGTVALALGGALLGAGAPGWTWKPVIRASRLTSDARALQLGVRLTLP